MFPPPAGALRRRGRGDSPGRPGGRPAGRPAGRAAAAGRRPGGRAAVGGGGCWRCAGCSGARMMREPASVPVPGRVPYDSSRTELPLPESSVEWLRRVNKGRGLEDLDDVFHGHWMIPCAHRHPPQAGKELP